MVSRARIKFAKKQVVRQEKKIEMVNRCDRCRKEFGITYIRTMGSAVCAEGNGLKTRLRKGRWEFFCNEECEKR